MKLAAKCLDGPCDQSSPHSGLLTPKEKCMSKLAYATALIAVLSVPALADTMSNAQMMRQMPSDSVTVTD